MEVVDDGFQIKITGKCFSKNDVTRLFDFGYSKEGIVKKYKKDNNVKTEEARNFVENVLFDYVVKKEV